MILYTDEQLDECWLFDCQKRKDQSREKISRGQYERLFMHHLENILAGTKLVRLDIYIPKWVFETIDEEILVNVQDTIN
jgi:hypothetical protein|tara:strand:- start:22 stop:258 length:237 start_codon:yes stop_codon:yes gene_type:complete